ncbi:hypothetical protein K435DRAFT_843966 [Dendrothele bispora CBS 962.96]|uniref:Uncharacterized protein n=1 Tax=Dendrothele bispora (strain CBS 962.96) TaxID=1314807 RepID=A0A4S8L6B5_DENBC|nr:hypothetical protein K435DRAFT_843966 [Dendrothele bispora CBS 962.96]
MHKVGIEDTTPELWIQFNSRQMSQKDVDGAKLIERDRPRHTWNSFSEYSVDTVDDPSLPLGFHSTGGSGTDGSRGVFEVKNECPEFELELEGNIVSGSGCVIIDKKAQLSGKHSLSLLMLEMSHIAVPSAVPTPTILYPESSEVLFPLKFNWTCQANVFVFVPTANKKHISTMVFINPVNKKKDEEKNLELQEQAEVQPIESVSVDSHVPSNQEVPENFLTIIGFQILIFRKSLRCANT